MSTLTTPRDLFLHELGDILYVEQKLADEVIPKLISEVQADELRKDLEKHLDQTRGHVTNVEQVFDVFGEAPGDGIDPLSVTNSKGEFALRVDSPATLLDVRIEARNFGTDVVFIGRI